MSTLQPGDVEAPLIETNLVIAILPDLPRLQAVPGNAVTINDDGSVCIMGRFSVAETAMASSRILSSGTSTARS